MSMKEHDVNTRIVGQAGVASSSSNGPGAASIGSAFMQHPFNAGQSARKSVGNSPSCSIVSNTSSMNNIGLLGPKNSNAYDDNLVDFLADEMTSRFNLYQDSFASLVKAAKEASDPSVSLEYLKGIRNSLPISGFSLDTAAANGANKGFNNNNNITATRRTTVIPTSTHHGITERQPNDGNNNQTKIVSSSSPPFEASIQDVLEADLLPFLYKCLMSETFPRLQTEALFLLHRLTCGTKEQLEFLVTNEIITHLILVMPCAARHGTSGCAPEFRQAFLATIRNLLLDSDMARKVFLATKGVVEGLVTIANINIDLQGVRAIQALLSGGGQHLSLIYHGLAPVIIFLSRVMQTSEDAEVLTAACNSCMYICDQLAEVQCLVDSASCIAALVRLLLHDSDVVAFDSLSVLAKVAYAGSTSQIDRIIHGGVVHTLVSLLQGICPTNPNGYKFVSTATRARACNCLGNIGCETSHQVQALIESDVFPLLITIFRTDKDYNTRIEAAYAVCASVSRADALQVAYIVSCSNDNNDAFSVDESNCMQLISDMLETVKESDPSNTGSLKLCKAILRGLDNILLCGLSEAKKEKLAENPYTLMFLQCHGDAKLREMQFYPDYTVVVKTNEILERYFAC